MTQNRLGMILGSSGIAVVVVSWVAPTRSPGNFRDCCSTSKRQSPTATTGDFESILSRASDTQKNRSLHTSGPMARDRYVKIGSRWPRQWFPRLQAQGRGLVDRPIEFSLSESAALGKTEHITMHHCIQGWSGIAQWGGVPMKTLIELVKPKPSAKTVAFFSFGGSFTGASITTRRAWTMSLSQSVSWRMK